MTFKIFLTFFRLGFFAFGGGYSMIPIIETETVDKMKLVDRDTYSDIVGVSGGLPGAIGLNIGIFVGYRAAKLKGAIAAALGSILPCVIIISTIMVLFSNISTNPIVQKVLMGIRPVVIALILYAAIKLGKKAYRYKWYFLLTLISFGITMFFPQVSIPLIIICAIVLGILLGLIESAVLKHRTGGKHKEPEE